MAIYLQSPDPDGNCCGCEERTGPCDPCTPVIGCSCFYYIPLGGQYESYNIAQSEINAHILDCYALLNPDTIGDDFSFDGETLVINELYPGPSEGIVSLSSSVYITIGASKTISIAYSAFVVDGTFSIASAGLYSCETGSLISSDSSTSASGTLILNSSIEGSYYLEITCNAGNFTSFNVDTSTTASDTFVINPVIALYDDSGTTRELEACPKLYLPFLTEILGDWYIDETVAQSVLDDNVVDSIAYLAGEGYISRTVSSGTSFTGSAVREGDDENIRFVISANFIKDDVINSSYSATITESDFEEINAAITIYDYTGQIVFLDEIDTEESSASGSFSSFVAPYSGRYIIRIGVTVNTAGPYPTTTTCDVVVESSGEMSVNPVQALYDVGLDCPARINSSP